MSSGAIDTVLTTAWQATPGARPSASAERRVMRASTVPALGADRDHRPRAFAEAHRLDRSRQDVERRQPLGPRTRQENLLRGDADAEPRALRLRNPWQEQRSRRAASSLRPSAWCATTRASSTAPAARGPERRHARVAQHLGRRPLPHHPAVLERDHRRRQPRHLGRGVADVEDRHPDLVAQPLEIGQDLGLARVVERGERLVRQDQPRRGRAGRGRSRRAASRPRERQPGRRSSRCADAEHLDHMAELVLTAASGREPAAVEQVLPHRQMREQAPLLEHVADAGGDAAAARTARSVSRSTQSSTAMRPRLRAAAAPATALTIVVLPAPERPNSTVNARRRLEGDVEAEARRRRGAA